MRNCKKFATRHSNSISYFRDHNESWEKPICNYCSFHAVHSCFQNVHFISAVIFIFLIWSYFQCKCWVLSHFPYKSFQTNFNSHTLLIRILPNSGINDKMNINCLFLKSAGSTTLVLHLHIQIPLRFTIL